VITDNKAKVKLAPKYVFGIDSRAASLPA